MQRSQLIATSLLLAFMIYALIAETNRFEWSPFNRYYKYLTAVDTNFENSSGFNVVFSGDRNQFPASLLADNESSRLPGQPNDNQSELLTNSSNLQEIIFADEEEYLSLTEAPIAVDVTERVSDNDEGTCTLPKIDPLDPTILKYINHPAPYKCGYAQPPNLFNLNDYGFIIVNITYYDLLADIYRDSNFTCLATTIDKTDGHGVNINRTIGNEVITSQSDPFPIETDAAEVKCTAVRKNGEAEEIYYNVFAYPRNLTRTILPTDDAHFSVHMLFTDSTSLPMFQRNLNKTYKFLTEELDMFSHIFYYANYTWFKGKRPYDGDEDQPKEFKLDYAKIFWDDIDYIWKNFSANGYVTSFNEDRPHWGLFHYQMKGFKHRPVDHYYHSFYWAIRDARTDEDAKYCFRNEPTTHIQLDVLKRENKKYRSLRHFAYVFQTEISHDTINDLGKYDDYYVKYFQEYSAQGYFDDKIIFVLSDHGHRFSSIRSTLIGTLEERLPMLGIIIPPRFCKLYPKRCENLKANREKLVTHFDLHETLSDIVRANYDGKQRNLKERNLSLFYSIPQNRTCKRAGIPKVYCTCQNSESMNPNDPVVKKAAKFVTTHINKLLKSPKNSTNACVRLRYQKILYAQLFQLKQDYAKKFRVRRNTGNNSNKETILKKGSHTLTVAFQVTPSKAKFEAMVKFNAHDKQFTIEGDVSRMNKYGNQSYCVVEPRLKKYCFCKGFKG